MNLVANDYAKRDAYNSGVANGFNPSRSNETNETKRNQSMQESYLSETFNQTNQKLLS